MIDLSAATLTATIDGDETGIDMTMADAATIATRPSH